MGQEIKSAPNPVGSLMQSGFASQEATRYRTNLDNNFAGHQRLAGAFAPQEGGPLYAFDPADVNTGSNLIDWTACPLLDDQPIKFENSVAVADLPDPLIVGTTYYVFNKLTNSFQVATSLASGTTALGLTDTGSGKHILVPQPIMRVWVGPGFLFDGATRTEVAGQFTAAFTAPVTNPRIDLVHIDAATGVVGVTAGAEAASPAAPALPVGKLPVALVTLQTSTTAISNQEIADIRALVRFPRLGAAKVYRSNNQTLTNGSTVQIQYDAAQFDADGNFDISSNYEYIVPEDGLYVIVFEHFITIGDGSTVSLTSWSFSIYKNESAFYNVPTQNPMAVSGTRRPALMGTCVMLLSEGDAIDFRLQTLTDNSADSTLTTGSSVTIYRLPGL